jgi:NADH-quinone oxidoreductase subunit B
MPKQLQPVKPHQPEEIFSNLYGKLPPNVFVAKADELFAQARASSLWPLTFGISCCGIEMISTYMANHDFDRFGVVTWPSPRQADVLLVAGTLVKKMAPVVRMLYEQMPSPKWVIAMGSCLVTGGPFSQSYSVVRGLDEVVPVDVYIPGCPPRPEALMEGILALQEKIKHDTRRARRGEAAAPILPNPEYEPAGPVNN